MWVLAASMGVLLLALVLDLLIPELSLSGVQIAISGVEARASMPKVLGVFAGVDVLFLMLKEIFWVEAGIPGVLIWKESYFLVLN